MPELADKFVIVKLLELYSMDHFFEKLRWMRQIVFDPSNLLSVPDVEAFLESLTTCDAKI